ncbi:PCI domain-containing protein [Diplocarpon rosae]|nr:PCI domain-containing protein [Diplocarpon rosae]
MLVKSTVAVALLSSFTAAQTFNSTIDPGNVPLTTKSQWCLSQKNVCGTLCSGELNANDCEPASLTYNCTCQSNNSAPGLAYYTGTVPTFICEQVFQNCIAAGENDAAAQSVCTKNEVANCGHLDADNFTAPAPTSSSSSSSPTGTGAQNQAATGTPATTSSSSAAAPTLFPYLGQSFGTGAMALGAAAAFGYAL